MLPFVRHWKIGAVLAFSALLTFQAAGWFLAWGILQFEAKTAAHIAMYRRETPIETATIPTALLSKIRVGKREIRLEGRLYDIVSQKVIGDSVALRLYHDRHEEAVHDTFLHLLRPGGSAPHAAPTQPLQNWLAQWLGSVFLVPQTPEIATPQAVLFLHRFTCLLPVAQFAPGCFSPPPKDAVANQQILA